MLAIREFSEPVCSIFKWPDLTDIGPGCDDRSKGGVLEGVLDGGRDDVLEDVLDGVSDSVVDGIIDSQV
jgi:hypothetical protein